MGARVFITRALVAGLLGSAACDDSPPTGPQPVRCTPNPIEVRAIHFAPTWSPDGSTVAYVGPDPGYGLGMYLVDTTATTPVKVMDGDFSGPLDLTWSPNGTHIAMWFQGEIQTLDVATHTLRQWTSLAGRYPNWPAWSPDSRYIGFTVGGGSLDTPALLSALRILDTQDGSLRALVRDRHVSPACPARWSPDSAILVFSSGVSRGTATETYWEIFSVRADGSDFRQVTFLNGSANNPQWSTDGQFVFFDFAPEKCPPGHSLNRKTWVMRSDGSDPRVWPVSFGNPSVQFSYPFALSPDGQHVAFVDADATGRFGVIHMMRLDGTGRKQLTFPPDSLSGPSPNLGLQEQSGMHEW